MNKVFMFFLFLVSTSFFLYQHSTGVSWDFSVYSLNSRYLLTGAGYFEWGRPPLPSVLMFFGEYMYIILVSLLGLFACIKFAKTYGIKPEVFYSLILSPFVLVLGFSVGTEFLSLIITILLFAYLRDSLAGLFAGLGFLSHYTSAFNFVFLFFSDKKFKSFLLAFLVLLPWFFFNYYVKGGPFYSFLDQYAKNVAMRQQGYVTPPDLAHFLVVGSFIIPFFVLGLFKSIRKPRQIDYVMVLFFAIKVFSYLLVPLKISRYLFTLALPFAYFSARSLESFNWRAAIPISLVTFLLFPVYLPYSYLDDPLVYQGINSSCMVLSNAWVFLNYYGVNAGPAPRQELVSNRLSDGYSLVFFKHIWDPEYVFNESFMHGLPVSYEDERLIIVSGDSCLPSYYYNTSYVEELNQTVSELYNESFTFTVWDII